MSAHTSFVDIGIAGLDRRMPLLPWHRGRSGQIQQYLLHLHGVAQDVARLGMEHNHRLDLLTDQSRRKNVSPRVANQGVERHSRYSSTRVD